MLFFPNKRDILQGAESTTQIPSGTRPFTTGKHFHLWTNPLDHLIAAALPSLLKLSSDAKGEDFIQEQGDASMSETPVTCRPLCWRLGRYRVSSLQDTFAWFCYSLQFGDEESVD